MDYYNIPANFTDNGKLFGLFEIRNAVEAVILALPLLYLGFVCVPLGLTGKLITGITLAVPAGGFALIGINDDCLTRFLHMWWVWLKNRKNLLYRGETPNKFGLRKKYTVLPCSPPDRLFQNPMGGEDSTNGR